MRRLVSRVFDLRPGEGRVSALSFAILFLVITAHTILETARDALFLSQLEPRELNLVYIALAGSTFVVAAASTRLAIRFGTRSALVCTLLVAAYVTAWIQRLPRGPNVALGLYLFSGLVGAVLAPQFWLLASQLFTVAQGRRLFGPIASGGVVGGVAGAGVAALLLTRFHLSTLMLVSAAIFVVAAILTTTLDIGPTVDAGPREADASTRSAKTNDLAVLRETPFLLRIAILVALSTAAVLTVDYLFKSTVAATIPKHRLGEFFARTYAAMNGLSLLVQLFVAGRLVRRFGVIGAASVMPFLLLLGGAGAVFAAGGLIMALATKGVDGGLRYSLNRVSTELLYLPLPSRTRDRGKAWVDSVLARVVQAITALGLYFLATKGLATPRLLATIIAALSAIWLAAAVTLRRPYLDLFRNALHEGALERVEFGDDLDMPSAEVLVEKLSSRDPAEVIAAMNVLDQHGRGKLVPALVLYHDDPRVLERACELLSSSNRTDWIPLAERLLDDRREGVRVSAVRALGRAGVVKALERAREDISSRVQAYATLFLAERRNEGDLAADPMLMVMVNMPGELGVAGRFGLVAAIADSPDPRATSLLLSIAERSQDTRSVEAIQLLARAMGRLRDPRCIPFLIDRLAIREGRDDVRGALVEIGPPALHALMQTLVDDATDRRVRLHVPRTISRFGTQEACDFLVEQLGRELPGLVRYKVLRGLGRMVAEGDLRVSRDRILSLVKANLLEHLRILALRVAIADDAAEGPSSAAVRDRTSGLLLLGLLDDKLAQSLERAFRLLKIAYRREDIHRVHVAALSSDKRARANAGEFLDVLLDRRGEEDVRTLLRLMTDEFEPRERVLRAAPYLAEPPPASREEALLRLLTEKDETVATIAAHHAMEIGATNLRAAVARARAARPDLESMTDRLFGGPHLGAEVSHA